MAKDLLMNVSAFLADHSSDDATDSKYRKNVKGRPAQPVETLTSSGFAALRSQGTDSVRGTWSSEGDAGHHFPCLRLSRMGRRARNRGCP